MDEEILDTEHGKLYTAISKPSGQVQPSNPAILLLHGNSCNSMIFENNVLSDPSLKKNHALIVFDLPGHGRSSDAPDPEKSYHQPGYADAALQILAHHGVKDVVVLGWSLGGHNAIETIPLLAGPKNTTGIRMLGMMAVGTPPLKGADQVGKAFHGNVGQGPAGTENVSHDDLVAFANSMTKSPAPPWLIKTTLRTDGRARKIMFDVFINGDCCDQVAVVQGWKQGWIAIVNGGAEPYVNLDYCDRVGDKTERLWKGNASESAIWSMRRSLKTHRPLCQSFSISSKTAWP